MARIVITISRQYGSGGSLVGMAVARRLGCRYFDREILKKTTEMLGTEEGAFSGREEKLSGFLKNIMRPFILGSPETCYVLPPIRPVYDRELFEIESKIILSIAEEQYDSVIVGRAANHVLRNEPGVINIFIHAPREFRAKKIMENCGLTDRAAAEDLMDKSDADKAKFIEAMTGTDWMDLRRYHLSIDMERVGQAAAEEMICLLATEVKARLESNA